MRTLLHENIEIRQLNNSNTKVAIVTHGGYTPRRGAIQTGSGKSYVPQGVSLHFYAPTDTVCIGTASYWLVSTGHCTNPIVETVSSANSPTENYSLTHDDKVASWNWNDEWECDVITVSKDKAHLNDVWEAFEKFRLNYVDVHCFFCRINKLTYTDAIT